MESGNGGASSKGVLVPVSAGSDAFRNSILAPLKSAYLYEESKQSFRYKSAFLINNPELEEKYNAFREKRKEEGYSEEDLKESYGFLLFDDVNKAHALGETGVLTGNSTCTTLGDPSKGVYISMYSDCLDLNRWYHGKSGYIAIIRLTKGKVKKVLENYTQNFTAPTERFDCHVSEQLPSVSANTSSFLAFERTQYYIYELLNDGSNETVQSPSAAFPFAIVSFSYTDTKATLVAPEEKSEEKKQVFHFYPWRGQLQIGTHFYDVGLRSTARALIPAELPPVVKIDRAISMLDLRQLLPRAVFETCFSGEVFLDGLYCSLCELVSTETEETSSVSLLLSEIKEKDVALTVPLSDGGFLILLHSSHFLTYDDTGSSATEVLQGIFVFPDSRVIQKDTKFGQRKTAVSSEILRVLPVLSYAEGEVEKTPTDPSEELCEVFAQHMQSYAALINPGLTLSPSRDISIFPDQYDVPDAHKHLYKSPEWTNRAWQNFKSYLSKPVSFQLPVSKASEILAAGQEERMEDLDDDLYFCLSSPEEAPASQASMESEDQQTGQKSVVHVETSVDSCITSAKDQVDLTTVPQNECLQPGDATKDTEKSDLTLLITTDDMGIKSVRARSTSDELPAELIVSITSAERTVTDASLSATTAESATKRKDFQHSGFSTAKVQTEEGNSLNDENVKTKKVSDPTNHQTKRRKYHRDNLKSQKEESSTCPDLSKPSNIDWRKVRKRKRIFGTLSSKHRKLRSAALALAVADEKTSEPGQQSFESTILMEHEAFPQRKKTERWDLKPVLSECGRILVPHGSVDIDDQIKTLKGKLQSTKDKPCHEKMLVDGSAKAHDTVEMEQESSIAKETAVDKTEDTTSKDGGNRPQNVENDNGSLTLNPKSSEHSSKNDSTDTPPLKTVQEKHTDIPSARKCATKGEFLLKKLKSVLLRGKRKMGILASQETAADTTQDTQPCLKKAKVDSESGMLKNNDAITSIADTNLDVKEGSKMLSVDPLFAYALGLTPKDKTKIEDKQIKSESQDTHERNDCLETREETILDKQPQIIQRPLSIFPKRGRIKTLKKHQGISEENVKKKCTPFQVSPLSGSTRLLHHHQTMYGDGIKTLHHYVDQEDRSENNHRTPEYLKKQMARRRKFRQSRTFVIKDESLQVTKQWKENYDFILDSKFTNDTKERAIVRALHGPWDLSIQDTNEEVRLIVHMWIGLFYSRSTARFFHFDSNCSTPCPEESDSLEVSSGMVSAPAQSELTAKSSDPCLDVTDTSETSISKALDLSKKDNSLLDQGSVILDLSLRNSNVEIVTSDLQANKKKTSLSAEEKEASATLNTIKSSVGLQSSCRKSVHSTDIISKVNDVRSTYESKRTCTPLQKAVRLELSDVPSFKGGGTSISVQDKMASQLEDHKTDSRLGHVLHRFNNEKTDMRDDIDKSCATEMSFVQKQGRDSSRSVIDKEIDSNKKAGDAVGTIEHDDSESKGEKQQVKEKPYQEGSKGSFAKMIHKVDDSTEEESGTVCNGSLLENEKQSSREEPQAVSAGKAEHVNKDEDCRAVLEVKVMEDDHFGKEDGLDEKDNHISDVEADSGVNDQPSPMMRDCPDSLKENYISECNGQTSFDEQPPQADGKGEACHDLELRKLCPNDSAVADEHAVSEKAPRTASEMEPIDNEPAFKENLENGVCLVDLRDDPLPMISDGPDSVKDCITENNGQTPLVEEPSQANNEEDACNDLELGKLSANGNVLTDEQTILEKAPHAPSEMEPVDNESAVEGDLESGDYLADLSDKPMSMTCDGPDSVRDCVTECNGQAPLDEQPPQADNEDETCSSLELKKLGAHDSALTDERAISEKAPHAQSDMEPIDNETAVDENSENGISLAVLSDQPIPMICDGPDSVNKDCITKCDLQVSLDVQPRQAENKGDTCHDLQLRNVCANDSALTDEPAISEKAPHAQSDMEPIDNETAVDENSENGISLAVLSDQPIPMICDGPDSVNKDCITKCDLQVSLDVQPRQAENKGDTCHDLQLRNVCANDSALTDEPAISEKAPHAQSDMEPIDNETAVEENSENGISLAVLSDQQIPMICDGPDSVNKDCITKCDLQVSLDVQPCQAENKGDTCHDLQLRNVCANAISEKAPHPPSEMDPIDNEPVAEANSENNTCLADEAHFQKSELPISDESTSSLVGSSADGSASQTNDSVATGGQNKAMATFSLSLHDHEEQDTKSDEKELKADDATQKDLFHHQFHSPQRDTVTGCEAEEALHKDADLKIDETHKGLEKIDGRIVIPFIGIDISGEDVVQSDDSHSEGKVQEVQDQNEITINRENTYPETVLPTEVCSTSQVFSKKEELSAGKKSLFDERETNQLEISESESDERCPTPTMDEEPYQYVSCYDPSSSSSSSFSGSENCKNMTQQHLGRSSTFIKDEMPLERKHKSTVGSDPNRQHGLRPDLELRTLRVLQSIGKFLSQSGHPDKSSQITTTDMERSLDQKDKLQDTSIGHNYCHPHTSFSSTELMQAFPPNIDQDRSKTTSQTNLGHEPRSNSQRPVMAVKPSKSDEIQTPVVTYIPSASMLFEKKTESLKGNSVGLNDDMQEASEHSSKSSCLSNVWDIKSHSNKAQFNQYQGRDPSKLIKKTSSSLPLHSFESAKTSSKLWTNMVADGTKSVDGNQCFLINSLVEKVAQTTNKSTEMDQRDCSDASTSVANYKDDSIMDDSLFLGPQSSITCTVFNTSRKRPVSFLEQLSQRCLQEDLTLASMEQECLIFSEQMKQLLKRSNRGPTHQLDAHNKLNVPCSSPVTVHFSSLEEEEDSLDYLDAPSLVGQKIEVDMSDRTDLAEEENTLHPQKSSQRTGNPMEHAGVSSVTSECARLYKAIMNDVCAVKKVPSTRPKHLRMDKGYLKTEPSNHFDFCEQMKRDVDQSFRSSLNSVVKKSCKTKYRFYILVTSDGAFFDETKAHLEAEGHTAVQPSEFFLDGDSTSSLLIIIRNEDIAEHICEVPHLLELKKSPGVQFAGIDEPDDVVNLTHQELFMRGGFIMFDRAAVESLSLCNMKKISEILQELSKMGKWKWMLHYRDSRRMKENARLSTEAKEKTQFLNWCQEVGILEVLPYHECDLMSRDQPDYLTCLVRLQVQNISARYPVFITDTTTDSAFGTNGILTLTFSSFLTSKTFPV
ncbi:uncharacterized protein tasor2 [Pagrus major]|uniref:uncharacterized protein tasor2 n=1 Tax=Pagrus major TaxID=143350 RepID=UPI003CC84F1A